MFWNHFVNHSLLLGLSLLLFYLVKENHLVLLIKWHTPFERILTTRWLEHAPTATGPFNSFLTEHPMPFHYIRVDPLEIQRLSCVDFWHWLVHLIISKERALVLTDAIVTLKLLEWGWMGVPLILSVKSMSLALVKHVVITLSIPLPGST